MSTNQHSIKTEDNFDVNEIREFAKTFKEKGKNKEQVCELLSLDDPSGEHIKEIKNIVKEVFE